MFVDEAVVRLHAGRGGNGCVSFHREKYVPKGGPDGGDGGHGGSIYLQGDSNLTTLYDLSVHPTFRADDGVNGGGNKKNGRAGKDLTIRVPLGTQIFIETEKGASESPVADIVSKAERILISRGGRGGGGNARFASAKNRLPRFALRGAPGQYLKVRLSLKLLSDLAIVGLPNCGKSTLLAAITAARPKIADYPFTTLTPNLGVVKGSDGSSVVLADIPGLIEGAHAGRGLGNRFLKHIDRAPAILILLDAQRDAAEDFELLRDEITRFNPKIWDRPRIVSVNKLDLVKRPPMKQWEKKTQERLVGISAKTGAGIEGLLKRIDGIREKTARPADEAESITTLVLDEDSARIERTAEGFRIISREWEELASMIPSENQEARQWFELKLRMDGVIRRIGLAGAAPGEMVRVGPIEFPYEGSQGGSDGG